MSILILPGLSSELPAATPVTAASGIKNPPQQTDIADLYNSFSEQLQSAATASSGRLAGPATLSAAPTHVQTQNHWLPPGGNRLPGQGLALPAQAQAIGSGIAAAAIGLGADIEAPAGVAIATEWQPGLDESAVGGPAEGALGNGEAAGGAAPGSNPLAESGDAVPIALFQADPNGPDQVLSMASSGAQQPGVLAEPGPGSGERSLELLGARNPNGSAGGGRGLFMPPGMEVASQAGGAVAAGELASRVVGSEFALMQAAVTDAGAAAAVGTDSTASASTSALASSGSVYQNLQPPQAAAPSAALMPSGPLTPAGPDWSNALAQRVAWMFEGQLGRAEIAIDPPELGPLQVRITTHQDQTQVQFVSQHAAVRDALDQALPRLRELLEGQGLQLIQADVSGQREQGARQHAQAQTDAGKLDGAGNPASESASPGPGAATSGHGLVDAYA